MDEEVTPATIATATIAAAATAEERQPATDDDVVPDFEASVTEPEVPDLGFDEIRKQADDLIGGAELEDDGEESSDDVVPEPIPAVLSPSPSLGSLGETMVPSSRRNRVALIAAFALAAFVVLGGVLVLARGLIASAFPSMTNVYASVGLDVDALGSGLNIIDVSSAREEDDVRETLVVTGVVANVDDEEKPVPLIRVALLDADDDEVQSLIVPPSRRSLSMGERMDFTARLDNPSSVARRIMVTFAPDDHD